MHFAHLNRDEFDILNLKARVDFTTTSSISLMLGRWETPVFPNCPKDLELDFPPEFCVKGFLDIHHPCDGHIKAKLRVQIPREYHTQNHMKAIVDAVFTAVGIPPDETFSPDFFYCDETTGIGRWIDRNGESDRFVLHVSY